MRLVDTIRTRPSGAPVAAGTEVRIYKEADGSLLATVTTDTNGAFEFLYPGNPGIVRYEAVVGTETRIHSTRSVMPVNGFDLSALPALGSAFLDGVVFNHLSDLQVTADGTTMNVTVGPGAAIGRGILYTQDTPQVLAVEPVAANPRIDLIAVRVWRDTTGNDVGRAQLIRRPGTEAVTPVATAPNQSAALWDIPLAHVRVDPGALGIATNKVTDARAIVMPFIPNRAIGPEMLRASSVNGSVVITPTTLGSSFNGRDLRAITLPPTPMRVKVRAHVVAFGATGDVTGQVYANVGTAGPNTAMTFLDGKRSEVTAVHTFVTSGETSLNISWGWNRTTPTGSLGVAGGFLEWDAFPA